jgi:hypothetical protein
MYLPEIVHEPLSCWIAKGKENQFTGLTAQIGDEAAEVLVLVPQP